MEKDFTSRKRSFENNFFFFLKLVNLSFVLRKGVGGSPRWKRILSRCENRTELKKIMLVTRLLNLCGDVPIILMLIILKIDLKMTGKEGETSSVVSLSSDIKNNVQRRRGTMG